MFGRDLFPVGVGEHGGDGVRHEDERQEEKHPLGVAVGPEQDEGPDSDRGDRHREVARDAEDVEGRRDAAEFGDHQPDVRDGEGRDRERRHPQRELFADEGGQSLPGMHGQPRHHLLHHDVGDGDQHHQEERAVDELRAGRGVRDDTAGVVAGGGRDESRPEGGHVHQPFAGHRRLHVRSLGKWKRPLVGTSASSTSSAKILPIGRPSSSTTTSESRRASTS